MKIGQVKEFFDKLGTKPKKWLGQHFLVNSGVLQKIVDAASLTDEDLVWEIGSGLGVLTKALAQRAKKVIAIEKDPVMAGVLLSNLREFKNIEFVQADILKFNLENKLKNQIYKLVANLPYSITSPVIRKFLETKYKPKLMVLMVQKEVAQRICAKPPKMNLLAVAVQFYGKPKIVSYVSKNSFWPVPKVDSAILKITPTHTNSSINTGEFFRIVKAGFSHPRKQLLNNFAKELGLKKEKTINWLLQNNIKPAQRAETLSLEIWKRLAKSFQKDKLS